MFLFFVFRVLAAFNIIDVSPVVLFGRAALIGLTSNGNDKQCIDSYPKCPTDPDTLVEYLNNYNGGFFRYFNGINPHFYNNPHNYPTTKRQLVNPQERILTKTNNDFIRYKLTDEIKFPPDNLEINSFSIKPYHIYQYKSPKTLVFPDYNSESNREIFKGSYRKRKGFSFPKENNNELIFQKPLSNYQDTPTLFPDRTGTGELIIDSEEFQDNSNLFFNL